MNTNVRVIKNAKSPIATTVGMAIRTMRQEHQLSIQAVADDLELPFSTIQQWETANRTLYVEDLIMLADYYEITIDSLLGRGLQ